MHTGSPREVKGSRTGEHYSYLMQWGTDHLPRNDHMEFQSGSHDPRILNLGVLFLAEDVLAGARKYFDDVGRSATLVASLTSAHGELIQPKGFQD